jgi:peroxiredoxin
MNITAVLCLAWLAAVGPGQPMSPKVKVGDKAPGFTLRDATGATVSLGDFAYQGPERPRRPKTAVLLDFFRTDCKACKEELPRVAEFHRKNKDRGVTVLLVALLEEGDDGTQLKSFFREHPMPFPVVTDVYGSVAKAYFPANAITLPTLLLVNGDGMVEARLEGLQADLDAALAEHLPR